MAARTTLALGLLVAACGDDLDGDDRQGGDATIDDRSAQALDAPMPTLTDDERAQHALGKSPFNFVWAPPQLGRLFNHSSCLACHGGNGRGLSSVGRDAFGSQALVRVSATTGTPTHPGGNIDLPGFGQQLQDHASTGLPEVFLEVAWREITVAYGDGSEQPMRSPLVTITAANSAPMPAGMRTSYRQGLPLVGLGLLEAIPEEVLRAAADPDDTDGDGISGRVNDVWEVVSGTVGIGRFGHKANVVTLREQVAAAFENDIGLSNLLFPDFDGMRDLSDDQLAATTYFLSTLAVPAAGARSAEARRGRELFTALQCAACHTPAVTTGDHPIPQLSGQDIHPYTDLLLHDLGDLLSDARPDFAATGVEWRTPPLWGLGLAQAIQADAAFLHDGRARTLEEAILWHGGEAAAASAAFRTAEAADRAALIAFLKTL